MTLRLGTTDDAMGMARAATIAARLSADVVPVPAGTDAVAALRDALVAGEVDVVLQSLSELTAGADGAAADVVAAAVPKRGDARDALCASGGRGLDALAAGARVGAATPLRRAQLHARRPDLEIVEVPGDAAALLGLLEAVDTSLDAVVVALAELELLGRVDAVAEVFDLAAWPTASAQGALVLETRAQERTAVARLEHRSSRLTTDAERAVAVQLADVVAPLAASALLDDGLLFLSVRATAADGSAQLTASHALYPEDARDPAGELAQRAAEELRAAGVTTLAGDGRST